MNAEYYLIRFEIQHRGSLRVHGVARISSDPGIMELAEVYKLSHYFLHNIWFPNLTNDSDPVPLFRDSHMIPTNLVWSSLKIKSWIIFRFFLTTINPNLWGTKVPVENPCMSLDLNWKEVGDLVRVVQTHSRCTKKYYRGNRNNTPCRFGFTKSLISKTNLRICTALTGKTKSVLQTARNNHLTNSYNQLQLLFLKRNCDIQLIINRG